MKRKFGFIILTVLLNSGIGYSQTNFWEPASTPLSNTNLPIEFRQTFSLVVSNNGDVWAGTSEGIFLSVDNGGTWVQKNNGIPSRDLTFEGSTYTFAGNIYVLAINPVNGSIFAGSMYGLYRSTDNGESWTTLIDLEDKYTEVRTILITPSGDIYVGIHRERGAPYEGVCYSKDNGDTWVMKNNGLPTQPMFIRSLVVGTDGTLYVSTAYFGVYRSTDGGDNWLPPSNYDNVGPDRLIVSADGSIFGAAGVVGVIKSTDKGVTWDQLNVGLNIGIEIGIPYYLGAVERIAYSSITDHLFISDPQNGVYRSTNLGGEWHKIENGIPTRDIGYNWVRALETNQKTGMVFIGFAGIESGGTSIYRSTPDIDSKIDINIEPESIDFGAVQSILHIDTTLYITNKGATDIVVTNVNIIGDDASSFSNTFNDAVTLKPNEAQRVSITFTPNTEGIKNAALEILADIGNIWISLNGNGTDQVMSTDEPEEIPTTYSLMQNYPNPFNPTTTIQYGIPKDEFVKLTVYDITGKVIKELVNGRKTAGKYSVEFNASSYSSGTYYYKLEAGEYSNIQKMILVK
jgi:photosystem II stability/assembly factor-like uncharacterized protein